MHQAYRASHSPARAPVAAERMARAGVAFVHLLAASPAARAVWTNQFADGPHIWRLRAEPVRSPAGPVSRSSETAYTTVAKGVCLVPAVHLVADEPPTPSKTELIYADREQGQPAYLQLICELVQDPVRMAGRPRCNTAVRAATCDTGGAGAKPGRVQAAVSKCARGASTHTTTLASAPSALRQRPASARPTCAYILVHGPHTCVPRLAATRARPGVAARPSPSRQQTPPQAPMPTR
mmetsp:Transcript_9954/g.23976  ORF Transcript_9954/g.23976 Transcript_9954/m.23976 type:complete len:237 (-) Transcript_9954:339-1049(-)